MMKTIDDYMAMPWVPIFDFVEDEDGSQIKVTIPGLSDFAVYGTALDDVTGTWREALKSHLKGYMAVQKAIPEPVHIRFVVDAPATEQTLQSEVDTVDLGHLATA
jgi:hypothetical protein